MKSRLIKLISGMGIALLLTLVLEGLASFYWLKKDYRAFVAELPRTASFKEEFHAQHDPDIGWVHKPGTSIQDFYGTGRHLTINQQGVRAGKEYGDKNNVVILGDSFTLGYGVDDHHTYPAYLQRMAPRVNIINMGQGGYSLGQCVQWYKRDGASFNPHLLVFAIIVDDIWRMGSTLTANGYATPEYSLKYDKPNISGLPLPEKVAEGEPLLDERKKARFISQRIALARLMASTVPEKKPDQEQLVKLAQAFVDDLDHPNVVLVLLPEWGDLTNPDQRKIYHAVATRLQGYASGRELKFLDLLPAFLQVGPDAGRDFFLDEQWHHYSEAGNEYVARRLYEFLSQRPQNPLASQP